MIRGAVARGGVLAFAFALLSSALAWGQPEPPKLPDVPKLPPYEKIPQPQPQQQPPDRIPPANGANSQPLPQPQPVLPSALPQSAPFVEVPTAPRSNVLEVPGKPFGMPPPLPGSVEDSYQRELQAREGFRTFTWRDTIITAFPGALLWEPNLAVQKDPRMRATYSNQPNFRSGNSLDTSIGGTQGLYRFDFAGQDMQVQTDIFAVVHTRLSPEDVTYADYRFGLPITVQRGWWQAKLAFEHTSSHLGDRLLRAVPQRVSAYARDEVVLGVGRILEDQLRLYANYAYAVQLIVPGVESSTRTRSRFDVGFEWFDRRSTGFWGTPFIAGNVEWMGSQGFVPNYTIQAGWMWRNPTARLGQFRVFAEHYRGLSPYGLASISGVREQYTALGIAFDY